MKMKTQHNQKLRDTEKAMQREKFVPLSPTSKQSGIEAWLKQ
jgi:hypothetical protein